MKVFIRGRCKIPRPRKIDDFESVRRGRNAASTPPPGTYSEEVELGGGATKGRFCWGGEFCNYLIEKILK